MHTRNAASVLPEPVGAEISVGSPRRIAGQPAICGSVGVPKRDDEPLLHERMRPGERRGLIRLGRGQSQLGGHRGYCSARFVISSPIGEGVAWKS